MRSGNSLISSARGTTSTRTFLSLDRILNQIKDSEMNVSAVAAEVSLLQMIK